MTNLMKLIDKIDMGSSKEIGIGMLGCGVVGSGVVRTLREKSIAINQYVEQVVEFRKILVRNLCKPRDFPIEESLLTTDNNAIIGASNIDVIVEVMGGVDPAYDLVRKAIINGKHIVTANKELMAKHGIELMALAEKKGTHLFFEASVGGGMPVIRSIVRDLRANDIQSIRAIINGTTNYIMSQMATDGIDFKQALMDAQRLGFAESDPNDDISGLDSLYKLVVLSTLAFRTEVLISSVYSEGIEKISLRDFQYARELGYSIKLLAIATKEKTDLTLRVHPALVPEVDPLAKVDGVFNAVEVQGDLIGKVIFQGPGAGPLPTSSAVVSDILEISRSIALDQVLMGYAQLNNKLSIGAISNLYAKYYLRLWVKDRPGVLAAIADVFGGHDVSIASVLQKQTDLENESAELVITTHRARESSLQKTISDIENMSVVLSVSSLIRVEEYSG